MIYPPPTSNNPPPPSSLSCASQMFSSNHDMLSYAPLPPPPPAASRWRPAVEMAPNCPRCDSANTKFCYYNNYSLSQPRYFCKGCRRYWTRGGSLRNVPVGGGCRKNRRGRPSPRPLPPPPPPPPQRHHSASCPDLMADDLIGGDRSATAGGIDIGALYAKYLNQRPQSDQVLAAGMPESLQVAESSESSSCDQIGHQQMLLDVQSVAVAAPHAPLMDEINQIHQPYSDLCAEFSSCLPMEHCSSCCTGVEELEAAPEISVHPQQSLLIHDEWSSLDYSSLEAFCRF